MLNIEQTDFGRRLYIKLMGRVQDTVGEVALSSEFTVSELGTLLKRKHSKRPADATKERNRC